MLKLAQWFHARHLFFNPYGHLLESSSTKLVSSSLGPRASRLQSCYKTHLLGPIRFLPRRLCRRDACGPSEELAWFKRMVLSVATDVNKEQGKYIPDPVAV